MHTIPVIVKMMSFLFLAVLCVAVVISPAESAPVQWSVNGHWYEARLRPGGINWQTAQNECLADGGYLATLTSAEENSFVYALISGQPDFWSGAGSGTCRGPWIGGIQPAGSPEPAGGWRWITCEAWSYTNWATGEPSNGNGTEQENRLEFFEVGELPGDHWNDLSESASDIKGYIFEMGGFESAPVQWSVNGHWYEARLRPGGINWQTAHDECVADGGYLATLTSAEENSFVYALISGQPGFWSGAGSGTCRGPWIGGYQPAGSPEPAGGWRWITDETWSYTNWATGEPSNGNGTVQENRLEFFEVGELPGDHWNDLSESASDIKGYIFEMGGIFPTPASPTTWGRIKALYR